MSHAVEPQTATFPEYYDRTFTSHSLGTEEELRGAGVVVSSEEFWAIVGEDSGDRSAPRPARILPKVFALVRDDGTGEVLVEITRDLPLQSAPNTFKIELRTTPAEMNSATRWARRRAAMGFAIGCVESARGKALQARSSDGFRVEVVDFPHTIALTVQAIADTDVQATVGVPADEIGVGMAASELAAGKLHEHLTVTWFTDIFMHDDAVNGYSPIDRVRYAVVMSAILRAGRILKNNNNKFSTATAKNAWGVRPRQALRELFWLAPDHDRTIDLLFKVVQSTFPSWANEQGETVTADHWQLGTALVVGLPFVERPPADVSVAGRTALLFEYRSPARTDYPDAFWRPAD
ncbi:hypothetical protein [Frankia gtarii]|uniref:hypothetical protein n=1 Tax=Frankia gtarii TaxID=2950102 RepID=UPI0021BEFA6F|nr:hypothetical protein [Frankia gtarii]